MEIKPVVLGCIDNYVWSDIEPWVVSLRANYDGDVVIFCWPNISDKTKIKIQQYNITTVDVPKDVQSIVVKRFHIMWYYLLTAIEYTHILTTDIKDVVFQTKLDFENRYNLSVIPEGFTYSEEPWSKRNLIQNFGNDIYEFMKDQPIVCAGIISGRRDDIMSLFLNIYIGCHGFESYSSGGGGPDQTIMNILLYNEIKNDRYYSDIVEEYNKDVHLGTSYKAIEYGTGDIGLHYKQGLLPQNILDKIQRMKKNPITLEDGLVCCNGVPWQIVHQYDRTEWKDEIRNKWGEQ